MIEYTLREALSCGIKQICLIIRPEKKAIEDTARRIVSHLGGDIVVRYQINPCGIADAVSKAEHFVDKSWFCILVPDLLLAGRTPALEQLLEFWRKAPCHMVGLYELCLEDIETFDIFGVNDSAEIGEGHFRVTYLYEKGMVSKSKFS